MNRHFVTGIAAIAALSMGAAATASNIYSGGGGAILDGTGTNTTPGVTNYLINVGDAGFVASLNSVTLDIAHTWVGDLEVTLFAPNGSSVHLFSRVLGDALPSTTFGDSSNLGGMYTFVNSGGANFSAAAAMGGTAFVIPIGIYDRSTTPGNAPTLLAATPQNNNGFDVFDGGILTGVWTLQIRDWAQGDTGSLSGWSFNVSLIPAPGALALLGLAGLVGTRRRRM